MPGLPRFWILLIFATFLSNNIGGAFAQTSQKLFVQAARSPTNCSSHCSGSIYEPFDSLLAALRAAESATASNIEILLLKASTHFVLQKEVGNNSTDFYLDFTGSSTFNFSVSKNLTIRPALCQLDVDMNMSGSINNCYKDGEKANLAFKSFEFQIVLQNSLILKDLIITGRENIAPFNAKQISVERCLNNRIYCCETPDEPLYQDINCTGEVTVEKLPLTKESSIFFLSHKDLSTIPELKFENCEFQSINLIKKRHLVLVGIENSHSIDIVDSNFSDIYTPYGLIGAYAVRDLNTSALPSTDSMKISQNIRISNSSFMNFNPDMRFRNPTDDSEGYILNINSTYSGTITIEGTTVFKLKGSREQSTRCLKDSEFIDPFSSQTISPLSSFADRFIRDHYNNSTSSVFRIASLRGKLIIHNNSFLENVGRSGTVLTVSQLDPAGRVQLTDNAFDGNFATTGFPSIRISSIVSDYFDGSSCGSIELNKNVFRNHLTCPNGYGNALLLCTALGNPMLTPALPLTAALNNLMNRHQWNQGTFLSNTIIAGDILPHYYGWNNLDITNNLFEHNLVGLTNSIGIFGGNNVAIVNNTFSENGLLISGKAQSRIQRKYAEQITDFTFDDDAVYLSTALMIEQTKDMLFRGNTFKNNWNILHEREIFPSQLYLKTVPEFFGGIPIVNCTFRDMALLNDSFSTVTTGSSSLISDSLNNSSPLIIVSYVEWPTYLVDTDGSTEQIPLGISLSKVTFTNNSFNFNTNNRNQDSQQFLIDNNNMPGIIKVLHQEFRSQGRPKTLTVESCQVMNNTFYGSSGYLFSNTDFASVLISRTNFSNTLFAATSSSDDRIRWDITDSPTLGLLPSDYHTLIFAAASSSMSGYVSIENCAFSNNTALIVYGYSNSYVNIQGTSFTKNKWTEIGIIVGVQSSVFQITDTNFTNNNVSLGVVVLQTSHLTDARNIFSGNEASICNSYFLDGVMNFEITKTKFLANVLRPPKFWIVDWHVPLAANIWLIDSQGTITSATIQNNVIKGGFIHMKSSVVSFTSCTIANNRAEQGIGLAYVSSSSRIGFLNSTITQNQHYYDPSAQYTRFHAGLLVISSSNVLIDKTTASYNVLGNGSNFLSGQDISIQVSNSLFLSNYDLSGTGNQGSTYLFSFSFGSIDISTSSFTYNGQLLELIDGISFLRNNQITGFQFGLTGPQILIDAQSGNLLMENNYFFQTTGGSSSLILLRTYDTNVLFRNCTFDSINQGTQPMFKFIGKSSVLTKIVFKSITTTQPIIQMIDMDGSKIQGFVFSCSSFWETALLSQNVKNLTLQDLTICHNQPTNVLKISGSEILIMNNISISTTTKGFDYYSYSYYNKLPLVSLQNNKEIIITNIDVKNQITYTANFFIENKNGQSSILITNSTFQSNQASQGGAITLVLSNVNAVNITNCLFLNNSAVEYSQASTSSQMSTFSGTALHTTMKDGGALKIMCASDDLSLCDIDIRNCTFDGNSARGGGGIYWDPYPPVVVDSVFINNKASYGPDLASTSVRLVAWTPEIVNLVNLDINSHILNFRNERVWPGVDNLAVAPADLNQYSPEYTLSLDINNFNLSFWKIKQDIFGGYSSPMTSSARSTKTTSASFFTMATEPELFLKGRILADDATQGISESILSAESSPSSDTPYFENKLVNQIHNHQEISISGSLITIGDVVSGVLISENISLALLDIYGQVVTTNNYSRAYQVADSSTYSGHTLLIQGINVKASDGIILLSGLLAQYYPGKSQVATFGADNINSLPESLKIMDFFADFDKQQTVNISLNFRDCMNGEYFERAGSQAKCVVCKENTFVIAAKNNSDKPCALCDKESMICLGGSLVAPAPGFWRQNESADLFLPCPNPDACLGGWNETTNEFSYGGFCADTYQGPLCSKCQPGYAKYKSGSPCVDCRGNVWYYLRFVGTILAQAFFIILNVRTNLFIYQTYQNEASRHLRTRSFLLKMLTNYLQVITLLDSFTYTWPGILKGIFSTNGAANGSSEDNFALDCFMYFIFGNISTPKVYIKATTALLLPVFFAFVLAIFWKIYFAVKKWKNQGFQYDFITFMNYVWGSTLIVAFNIQPMVLKAAFFLFECQNIYRTDSPQYHLVQDYNVECWTSSHLLWVVTTGVITISLWGLIMPLIIFINVKRKKQRILRFEGTGALKYSFIVFGYREEVYYWEFVILIRKYLVLIIITSVAGFSKGSQFILIMFVILVASLLHNKYQPYESPKLNQLETVSLFSIQIFVVACLYFSSIDKITALDVPVIIICLVGNLVFLFKWLLLYCKTSIEYFRGLPYVRKILVYVEKVNDFKRKMLRSCSFIKFRRQLDSRTNSKVEVPQPEEGSNPEKAEFEEIELKEIERKSSIEDGIDEELSNSVTQIPRLDSSSLFALMKSSRTNSNNNSRVSSLEDITTRCTEKTMIISTTNKNSRKQTMDFTDLANAVINEIPDSANFTPTKEEPPKKIKRVKRKKYTFSPRSNSACVIEIADTEDIKELNLNKSFDLGSKHSKRARFHLTLASE